MKPLYAIAYELYNRKGNIVKADIEYVHANDCGHARAQYCLQHPNRRTHKIVGVSVVIGYHAQDDNADIVNA